MKAKGKIIWVLFVSLIVVTLLLASCSSAGQKITTSSPATTANPAAKSTTTASPAAKPTTTASPATKPTPTVEKPKYGGTLTVLVDKFQRVDPYRYDNSSLRVQTAMFEKLFVGDWVVDRNKWDYFNTRGFTPLQYMRGCLAESWELPDSQTLVVHLRKNIKWQNKPPVNGRAFTMDDFLWNLKRYQSSPFLDEMYLGLITSTTVINDYTVELKLSVPAIGDVLRSILDTNSLVFVAPECVGNKTEIEDWKKAVGTGPFIWEDWATGSSLTFKKNPDYWGYDEKNPGNRLPYVDTLKFLIIMDTSTRMAALRTAQIDWIEEVEWPQAEGIIKSNPEILVKEKEYSSSVLFKARVDTKPFDDVRVRQAMNMAIDREAIGKKLYGGRYIPYVTAIRKQHGDLYTPYDKLPQNIKEIHSYNPTKAKQLLAEAGYPNGFKTNIVTSDAYDSGQGQILQAYLADIGIQAELRMMEKGAFTTVRYGNQHDQMILHWMSHYMDPLQMFGQWTDPKHKFNSAITNDPVFNAKYNEAVKTVDDAKRGELIRWMNMYSLEQAWFISLPIPMCYTFWHPWLKGYAGETALGGQNLGALFARMWIDQDLKKSKGH